MLAGHISWGRQPGAFAQLGDLREGDPVVVEVEGRRWEFRVTWRCAFDRDTPRAGQIMGRTSVPSVTLVTCGGTFDRRAGTHTHRIVVRAELASVTRGLRADTSWNRRRSEALSVTHPRFLVSG